MPSSDNDSAVARFLRENELLAAPRPLPPSPDAEDVAGDRIRSIPKIAEFLNESPRRIAYLIETGVLPVGREGTAIVASKARLREYHRRLTGGGETA